MNRIANPLFHLFVTTLGWPALPTPPGKTETDLLTEKVQAGLADRWPLILTHQPESDPSVYQDRLDHELAVITGQEADTFFLILADSIDHAAENGIYVPPVVGAAYGSLVCFCLGLTHVDPVAHGLLFERFFNANSRPIPCLDMNLYDSDSQLIWRDFFALRNRALIVETLTRIKRKGRAVPDLLRIKPPPNFWPEETVPGFFPFLKAHFPVEFAAALAKSTSQFIP